MLEDLESHLLVDSTHTRRIIFVVLNSVPNADGRSIPAALFVGEEARREVVTEAFADCGCFERLTESRTYRVLNGVAQLVKNDFRILGIIYTAQTKCQTAVMRAVPGVVLLRAVGIDWNRFFEDRPLASKAERLKVSDCPIDVEVRHHFLERRIPAGENELSIRAPDARSRKLRRNSRPVEMASTLQAKQSDR